MPNQFAPSTLSVTLPPALAFSRKLGVVLVPLPPIRYSSLIGRSMSQGAVHTVS